MISALGDARPTSGGDGDGRRVVDDGDGGRRAAAEALPRDVVFDLLLDGDVVAVVRRVARADLGPPVLLLDEGVHEVVRARAGDVVVAAAADDVVALVVRVEEAG